MSIEQTNQLILLILNSVLMMLLSAALLGGAWLRQNMLSQQLHQLRLSHRAITQGFERHGNPSRSEMKRSGKYGVAPSGRETSGLDPHGADASEAGLNTELHKTKASLKQIRSDRQRLSNQYLWSHIGMLMLHWVLLVFGVSLLALALRSLISFDSLISTALVLFALGSAGLLAGTGCILMDLVQGNSSGDSIGHSLGRAIAQIGHWWKKRQPNGSWTNHWTQASMPLLIQNRPQSSGHSRYRQEPSSMPITSKAGR